MNIRRLSDFVSPQIGAVSGGRQPAFSEEDYIEGMAEYLPEMEQAEYNRKMTEEQIGLDREARKQAVRDSNISLGIESANLGIKAYPYLSELAKGSGAASAVSSATAPVANVGLSEFVAGSPTGLANTAQGAATGGGLLSSMSNIAKSSIPSLAGYAGGKLGGDRFTRKVGSIGGLVKNKTTQKRTGAALKGAAAGAIAGAAFGGPVGAVGGGLYGAISGFLSSF
jgi:hypothetical protein